VYPAAAKPEKRRAVAVMLSSLWSGRGGAPVRSYTLAAVSLTCRDRVVELLQCACRTLVLLRIPGPVEIQYDRVFDGLSTWSTPCVAKAGTGAMDDGDLLAFASGSRFRARGSALFEIALGSTSVDRNLEQWTLPVQWSAPSQLSDEARLEADAAVATQVLRQLATLASVDAPDYHQQGGVVVSVNVVSAA